MACQDSFAGLWLVRIILEVFLSSESCTLVGGTPMVRDIYSSLGEYCSGQLGQRLFLRQQLECGISSGKLVTTRGGVCWVVQWSSRTDVLRWEEESISLDQCPRSLVTNPLSCCPALPA